MKPYLEELIETAKRKWLCQNLFNRRRYIPELQSKQFFTRSFGERAAMNAPLQGTAADLIKLAMVRINQRLNQENLATKILLQVHDELILEVPENEISQVEVVVREEMENVAKLRVPLTVEISTGKSWAML